MSCVLGCLPCPEYIGGPRPPPNLLGEGVGVQVGLLPPTHLGGELESKVDASPLSRLGRRVQVGISLPSLMAPRWRWSWSPPPPIRLGGGLLPSPLRRP